MCDSCLAQKGANCDDLMNYKNFFERGWEYTTISHEAYLALDTKISDWACIPGWRVETVMYDFMHNVYLGPARDLVASAVRCLLSADWFGSLDAVQNDMIQRCRENGFFAGTSIGLLCPPNLCPKTSRKYFSNSVPMQLQAVPSTKTSSHWSKSWWNTRLCRAVHEI